MRIYLELSAYGVITRAANWLNEDSFEILVNGDIRLHQSILLPSDVNRPR